MTPIQNNNNEKLLHALAVTEMSELKLRMKVEEAIRFLEGYEQFGSTAILTVLKILKE